MDGEIQTKEYEIASFSDFSAEVPNLKMFIKKQININQCNKYKNYQLKNVYKKK
ncbi:MAG: hypothetical protein KO202_05885 [Methanobacteriaceae archaeon]|jgi:hypothetical protein|nr:hypothetical protein [Methanobacteriaceae archaeon]